MEESRIYACIPICRSQYGTVFFWRAMDVDFFLCAVKGI